MREVVALVLTAVLAFVAIVAGALLLIGCKGDDLPGLGPTVTTSHPELRAPFLRAADIVGDSIQPMIADPALVLDVILLDGENFTDGEQMDGVALWGRNRINFSGKLLRCEDVIGLRVPASEVKPSGTSLAHEAAHCALDWLRDPDPGHTRMDVWGPGGVVQAANDALRAEGL